MADFDCQWIRELAEPLIPDDTYDQCIRAADNPKKALRLVQTQLPPLNRACLLYLAGFLRELAEHDDKTKMTVANLAMVFSPNVLRYMCGVRCSQSLTLSYRCPSTNPQVIFENSNILEIMQNLQNFAKINFKKCSLIIW